jgi:cell wall-associated NlpC family hydrolase
MGRGVPSNQIALAQQYGRQYGIDPRLLLAIGGHETRWGTLGAGRQGYTLGYGATDTGLLNQYAGVANQYRGAAKTLAGWGARSIKDVLAGKASRYATDPAWEKGVGQTYASLGGNPTLDATRFDLPDASPAPRELSAAPAPLDRGAIIRQAFLGQLQGKQFSLLDLMRQLREQRTAAARQPAAPAVGQAAAPTVASDSQTSPAASPVVSTALTQIGKPYVWGAESPKQGFDCSGLLYWAYGKRGVDIPRTSQEQWKAGTPVPKNQLRPGDAVFWKGYTGGVGGPGHVGMYVGNGQVLVAPQTGETVHTEDLSRHSGYMGARRFT